MMEVKRSDEYSKLLEELRNSFISAADIAVRLFEQGKKDGLPNHIIRQDVTDALDGVVKRSRLYEILPLELKRPYTINESPPSGQLLSDTPGQDDEYIRINKLEVLNLSDIAPNRFSSRLDYDPDNDDKFWGFVDSIRKYGLIQPIHVRSIEDGKYEVVSGDRRYYALEHLGVHRTGVQVRDDLQDDVKVRIFSLNENIHRTPLTDDEMQEQLLKIACYSDSDIDRELAEIITEAKKENAGKSYTSNYDRVSAELRSVLDKINLKHIPEICEALHRENPGWTTEDIKNRIKHEFSEFYPGITHDRHLLAWTIQSKTRKLSKDRPKA